MYRHSSQCPPRHAGAACARERAKFAEGCAAPLALSALFLFAVTGCGSGTVTPPPAVPGPPPALTITDVQNVVQAGAEAADPDTMVIAVVDRAGRVLAVFRQPNAPATATGNFGLTVDPNDLAVALARTAAFFSNDRSEERRVGEE